MNWRTRGPGLLVHAHRDGRLSWSPIPGSGGAAEHDGTGFLSRALQAVVDSGDRIFVPEDVREDSLGFYLRFRQPVVTENGEVRQILVRYAVPMFTMAVPWETPSRVLRAPRITFPESPRKGNAEGVVWMEFVVKPDGTPDRSTIKAHWPENQPPLPGDVHSHYQAFVAAARRGVTGMLFEPARVGGCPVRQFVRQPVEFRFR